MARSKTEKAQAGAENTFRALGIPNPEVARLKSDIALAIFRAIEERGLTQKQAATIMGVDQAKVSAITRGITRGYSVERLLVFLNRLDIDVNIWFQPKPKAREHGRTRVIPA